MLLYVEAVLGLVQSSHLSLDLLAMRWPRHGLATLLWDCGGSDLYPSLHTLASHILSPALMVL